jgi:hypothetical protein
MRQTTPTPPTPLELAKLYRLPQREIAIKLDCTVSWARVLARDPHHSRRILVAVLEALLDREREHYLLDSMLSPQNGGSS